MDTFLGRYKNLIVLAAILFAQIVALAVQVRRPAQEGETRLIRLWAISAVTPIEKAVVHSQEWVQNLWTTYAYLRGVRRENRELRAEIGRMKIDDARFAEDARMARRVQALLAFKEQYVDSTIAAQVIGTSGSEQSRVLYLDKGSNDGIKTDMAVITPTGIVGKIVQVFPDSSQVLPINDQFSGVGAALKDSRLQGILKGAANGATTLQYIMSDEKVVPGEEVITSGGDRIFPKGLPVGRVVSVEPGKDLFLNIRVVPSSRLDQLEEVLVVTKITEKMPDTKDLGPLRASDILAERLPTVPTKTEVDAAGNAKPGAVTPSSPAGSTAAPGAHPVTGTATGKPLTGANATANKPAAGAATANKVPGTTPAKKPAVITTTPRATTPGTMPGAAANVKPKPATPSTNPAGTITKPANGNAPATTAPRTQSGSSDDDDLPVAPKQPKTEPAPSNNSDQPATPPAGAPPQP
ncbi:MAG: rod shape-determining protein MreC [Candidatus Korobacteraceae bacterium]